MGIIIGTSRHLMIGGKSSSSAGVPTTISGVSPLLFIAKSSKLYSLKRFGKVEQNGTTPPDVELICNNGTLGLVDSELPIGYKRLTGISFDGSTYYETNEKLYGSDIVTITISDFVSSGQNLFGCYSGTSDDVYNFSLYIYGTTTGQAYWRYGKNLYRPTVGNTNTRTITFGAGGTTGFKTDVTYPEVDFETTSTARIGALPNSSSSKYEGIILGNITISNRLKYIPCERISDGTIGYYETYNGNFLEPVGSPVSEGYDSSHLELGVVGTPEEVTLGLQTANVQNLFAVGNVKDEQDIISGTVIRRCGVCVYDGTQQIGDTYISTTGDKTVGAIIVYPLDEATTEHVTPQHMVATKGNNTVTSTANVSNPEIEVTYSA